MRIGSRSDRNARNRNARVQDSTGIWTNRPGITIVMRTATPRRATGRRLLTPGRFTQSTPGSEVSGTDRASGVGCGPRSTFHPGLLLEEEELGHVCLRLRYHLARSTPQAARTSPWCADRLLSASRAECGGACSCYRLVQSLGTLVMQWEVAATPPRTCEAALRFRRPETHSFSTPR